MDTLSKSAKTYLALRNTYESCGYRKYAMRKFEEYSLYLENKNFLTSEYVITFNDLHGRLMALKPDVTLSILKNSKGRQGSEKVYYRESVYRLDRQSSEYREIEQLGLEMINCSDIISLTELTILAMMTLQTVDDDYILCVSDMNYVGGMLDTLPDASEEQKSAILSFISQKNPHELKNALTEAGASEGYAEGFADLISLSSGHEEAFSKAEALARNDRMKSSLRKLEKLIESAGSSGRLRLDFSLVNDVSYYSSLVFCGYVSRIPRAVLTGGCYDKLAHKFGKDNGAAGFALCLSDLNGFYDQQSAGDIDVLLLYSEESRLSEVLDKAFALRREGKRVLIEKSIPEGQGYREIIRL